MISLHVKKELLNDISLDIKFDLQYGEFLALKGKSGSGKTTFLRILAGLESASGYIKIDDEIWLDEKTFLPPQKRSIGFVFQDYALFPNMSVIENLLYVKKDLELAKHLLEIIELEKLKDIKPANLSGGQKQRVA